MESIELEKTYLAKELPKDLANSKNKEIIDIYFPITLEHPKLRLRKNGEYYELTKKFPINQGDASNQIEQTVPLSLEEFNSLSELPGKKIHKIRYFVEYNNYKAEIDVFQGELKGLVLVDFEFNTELQLKEFKMPEFCLADITQEIFIAGGKLCGKTYADIKEDLDRFNYVPLYI